MAVKSTLMPSLVNAGKITQEQANEIQKDCEKRDVPYVQGVVESGFIQSDDLANFCTDYFGLALLNLDEFDLQDIPKQFLNEKLIRKYHALPVYLQGHTLYLALSDPTNVEALEEFGFVFSVHTEPFLVDELKLQKAIKFLTTSSEQQLTEQTEANGDPDADLVSVEGELNDLSGADAQADNGAGTAIDTTKSEEDDAPVVKFINQMLLKAISMGASDLHFEPYETKYRVRFRIDGILHQVATPPVNLKERFSARLKVMSRLDIAEKRLPQDGRIKLKIGANKTMDMRVNSLPTLWGEKIVLRILDSSAAKLNIDQLGFNDVQKKQYLDALAKPQGLILVTGPTGSGKTVSLYTGLSILNDEETNISTAEDPVEINLYGINQVQMNPKAGLTFASALRAFLRQDPDVIMVGEIRDLETAEIAIKSAQTGHLVLSTLHTNSAAETLTRLLNMGVPSFNIASSCTLIMAQRLARRLCQKCKVEQQVSEQQLRAIGYTEEEIKNGIKLFGPAGCSACSSGYKGRVGIYEIMVMNDRLAEAIMNGANSIELNRIAVEQGMQTLRRSALEKASLGLTSLAEVRRVTS
ncbi:MAG: type IV-A pilus assembly ATPase PilB [Succinivibrionaceae bacterium]|jgi:type IV pilus assembly protein PilB|nr:type IV-A pilus assembly ATPase PilB [Succinivibrionaceae bacterium]